MISDLGNDHTDRLSEQGNDHTVLDKPAAEKANAETNDEETTSSTSNIFSEVTEEIERTSDCGPPVSPEIETMVKKLFLRKFDKTNSEEETVIASIVKKFSK